MKTQIIIGIIAVIAVIIIAGVVFTGGSDDADTVSDTSAGTGEEAVAEGNFDKAPEFAFADYDGNEVTSADFEGKALVINSWASWCPFCIDEMPDFSLLQEEFANDIAVIAINRGESKNKAKEFSDSLNVTDDYVFLLDPSDSFYERIGGFSMPETLFVDSEGNIRVHKRGIMDLEEMREHVAAVLEK